MANSTTIALPELRDNNPYYTGVIVVFADGSLALDPGPLAYTKSEQDRYYTVIDEENLSNIAFQAYGDSKLWHLLAKVNNLFDPFTLESGSTLLIPDLAQIQMSNL